VTKNQVDGQFFFRPQIFVPSMIFQLLPVFIQRFRILQRINKYAMNVG